MKRIMKTITIAATALSLTLLCSGPLLAQSGNDLFQQALVMERAEGDVQGAIELYQRIAREFAADRPLAAKALVQMGLCYEKLGLTEARQTYQQVIDAFPEQREEVQVARERLALLAQALAELESGPTFRKIQIASRPQNASRRHCRPPVRPSRPVNEGVLPRTSARLDPNRDPLPHPQVVVL